MNKRKFDIYAAFSANTMRTFSVKLFSPPRLLAARFVVSHVGQNIIANVLVCRDVVMTTADLAILINHAFFGGEGAPILIYI